MYTEKSIRTILVQTMQCVGYVGAWKEKNKKDLTGYP